MQSTAPQSSVPPLRSGTANLCPAPTSVRDPEKNAAASSANTEGALKTSAKLPAKPAVKPATKAAVKPSAVFKVHALHDNIAAAATDGSSGGKEGLLPDLPSTAAIASELYGLRLNDDDIAATSTSDGQHTQPRHRAVPGRVLPTASDASVRVSEAASDAATAASSMLPGAESAAPSQPTSDQSDAESTQPMSVISSGPAESKSPSGQLPIGAAHCESAQPVLATPLATPLASPLEAPGPIDNGISVEAVPNGGSIPQAGAEAVGDRVLLCEDRLDFKCTVEESPGMPWPRAKFEARARLHACSSRPTYHGSSMFPM